jgi:hypothetical protein
LEKALKVSREINELQVLANTFKWRYSFSFITSNENVRIGKISFMTLNTKNTLNPFEKESYFSFTFRWLMRSYLMYITVY